MRLTSRAKDLAQGKRVTPAMEELRGRLGVETQASLGLMRVQNESKLLKSAPKL
jgi:hypothetical protein